MKKFYFLLMVFFSFQSFGQLNNNGKILFKYDAAGNQILRELVFTRHNLARKKNDELNTKVYPNPTDGLFKVTFDEVTLQKAKLLQIYNNNGQLIVERPIDKTIKSMNIDIQKYPYGIYFVNIVLTDEKHITKKIIKQ